MSAASWQHLHNDRPVLRADSQQLLFAVVSKAGGMVGDTIATSLAREKRR